MAAEVDLSTASREDLLTIIALQQAAIAELERRVAGLETRLGGRGGPRGMPGNKPGAGPRPTGEKRPRKQRFQGFARRRMEPTERVEHAVEVCPDYGTRLSGGWTHRTREVIDIPESAVRVTEHAVIARECPVLRDIRDLKSLYPKDARLSRWASAVKELYTKARESSHTNVRKRSVAQRRLEHRLLALCRPYATDPSAVQGKLGRRIEQFIKELFVFVAEPGRHRTTTLQSEAFGTWCSAGRSAVARALRGGPRARWLWLRCSALGAPNIATPSSPAASFSSPLNSEQVPVRNSA